MIEVSLTRVNWRFLLMCFLLVALSFQGIAQAKIISCEQGQPGHGFLLESTPDRVQASAGHTDHHHHAFASEKAKTFKDDCNRCAPCCIGAAMLMGSAFQISAPVAAQNFPALTVAEHSTDPGRLDRPPKIFLA
jgi:hypothetical protein